MSEPKTVEIRVPDMPTMTGSDTTWARLITSVKEKAKTGYDWDGKQLYCGKLVDLQQGDIFITGGSSGSRKHGKKYVQMHVVIDEGYLIMVACQLDNEWAVKMRQDAHDYLPLPWQQRIIKALNDEIEYLDDPGYDGNGSLDERKLLIEKHRAKLAEFGEKDAVARSIENEVPPLDKMFGRFPQFHSDRKKAELLFRYIQTNGDEAGFFHWLLGVQKMAASDAVDLAAIPS